LGYLHCVFPKIQFIITTHSEHLVNEANMQFVQTLELL
ncbi:MAG: hypothetical protein RLZZ292_1853, partial [Bacteroidota bacterium]